MKKVRSVVFLIGGILLTGVVRANNLQLANVAVSNRDDHTAFVKFDISWENSWRYTNINHDAAWVFFKVRQEGSADWQHVILEGAGLNPTDYAVGVGTGIDLIVPSERTGMFVRRSAEGAGTVSVTNIQAVWNFASNSLVKTSRVYVQAMAVEMVYVAEGTNTVGSGGTESGSFTAGPWASGATTPFQITSEAALEIGNASGKLWGTSSSGNNTIGGAGTLLAYFPKGYKAFYCMKYEVSEGQYVDFLNTLTSVQATSRVYSGTPRNYYWITTNTVGTYVSSVTNCACNYLSWADECAYLDWAGLRPMTELEFEKACRGFRAAVANEYAWGSTVIVKQTGYSSGQNTGSDVASPSNANCNYASGLGPVRGGIYATSSSSREQAGASYWGIMELSGNFWEHVVTVGNATGRAFTGEHGDGALDASGNADVTAWPPAATAVGSGYRGGQWIRSTTNSRVSDRELGSFGDSGRGDTLGCRGGRTAPTGIQP